jgi:hypothetical protein
MSRLLVFLFLADSVLSVAGSPDLLVAIRNGDYSSTQKLLRTGADVNTADNDGTTALMHSVIESDVNLMRLLIDNGANINAKNAFDSTALMYAATNVAKTRLLLDRAVEQPERIVEGARVRLHDTEVVRLLGRPRGPGRSGEPPLADGRVGPGPLGEHGLVDAKALDVAEEGEGLRRVFLVEQLQSPGVARERGLVFGRALDGRLAAGVVLDALAGRGDVLHGHSLLLAG